LQDKLRNEENSSVYLENIIFEDIEEEFSKIGERNKPLFSGKCICYGKHR
jgi:hypothetical protein